MEVSTPHKWRGVSLTNGGECPSQMEVSVPHKWRWVPLTNGGEYPSQMEVSVPAQIQVLKELEWVKIVFIFTLVEKRDIDIWLRH